MMAIPVLLGLSSATLLAVMLRLRRKARPALPAVEEFGDGPLRVTVYRRARRRGAIRDSDRGIGWLRVAAPPPTGAAAADPPAAPQPDAPPATRLCDLALAAGRRPIRIANFLPDEDLLHLSERPALAQFTGDGYLLRFEDGQSLLLAGLRPGQGAPRWTVTPELAAA